MKELTQLALTELPMDLVPNIGDKDQNVIHPAVSAPTVMLEAVPPDAEKSKNSSGNSVTDPSSDKESSSGGDDGTPIFPVSEPERDFSEKTSVNPLVQKELQLSSTQSMFWFITVYLQDKTTLNHFVCSRVLGKIRVYDLERAVGVVAQRHEALMTCSFTNEKQQPMQGILETSPLRLERKWIGENSELQEGCSKLKMHTYDLSIGETMRILLLSRSADEHYLLIGRHHINVDGISQQVLMSDLQKAYDHQPLDEQILQYPEYSIQQATKKLNEGWKSELNYWKREMEEFDSVLPILSSSSTTSRRDLQEYRVYRVDLRLDSASASRIKDVCRRKKATPFHFYLVVWKILLFRFGGRDDLCIGMADGNRSKSDMLQSIGPFVDLLPLWFRRHPSQTF